ncbi:MAG: GGDEF domain-containing protein [Nitrospirae bacterium]|nr:GGDEF domain-containing protein [Nitrospirota bacterium]
MGNLMPATPRLLDQLADLTSIRDLELLEFSLMKTLHSFFRPKGISMIKLDMKYRPRMEIVFGESKCTIRLEQISLPEATRMAIEHLVASEARQYILRDGDDRLIIYNIIETRSARTFLLITTKDELSKMDSHMVSGVLQVYRNFCDLLRYAQTDLLTGLANRKTFDECIMKIYELIPTEADEFPDDRRDNKAMSYWLAMIDIDHFKAVNDRFGHLYGDEVLVLMAQVLKSVFREDDMLFRFGGEEFVVILRCPDKEGCKIALERLRRTVEEREFPQVGTVTISIGATRIDRSIFAMTLIDYADQALYHSKNRGRNQIAMFDDLIALGLASVKEIESGDITLF